MPDKLSSFGRSTDAFAGPFQGGIGMTRPGLSDLTVRLDNVGGISSKISGSKNKLKITSSPERQALIDASSNFLAEGAAEATSLRELVRPGFSAFRKAGLEQIGTRARQSIGNLKENLARRRVAGSSFAGDAVQRAEREFAQEESQFAAATTLQEIDVFNQLTQQITNQQVASVERKIQELNLQLDVGLQLAGAATQSLTAASIQQQQNQQAFASSVFDIAGTGAGFAAGCSKHLKTHEGSPETILEGVEALPIQRWRYRPEAGLGTSFHVGPYAEDFHRIFRVGDGQTLNFIDLTGVCLQAIKDLSEKVRRLEAA